MSRWLVSVLVAVLLVGALTTPTVRADDGDETRLARPAALIGGQVDLELVVVTPKGSAIEVNTAFPGWNNVEVLSTGKDRVETRANDEVHHLRLVVASFLPGNFQFQPAVTVVQGSESSQRVLPESRLQAVESLAPGAPLELSPLEGPREIGGGASPLLGPAMIGGAVIAILLLAAGLLLGLRMARRRRAVPGPESSPFVTVSSLDAVETLIHTDPVRAYRLMAAAVRHVVAERYGLPAPALTSVELQRRLHDHGVDRIQARMVGGLLDECDAVLYAGYRPATGRRMADLGIAREIVEVTG